jgi:hypothetical protein
MSNTPDDNILNLPSDIDPINPSEIIIPAKEALHNAAITQSDVKSDYHKRVEEQDEKKARLLAKIKREREELKKNPDMIKYKIRNLKEQINECDESLHYARQDVDALVANADITGKVSQAKIIVERIEKEIYDAKKEISELEGLL